MNILPSLALASNPNTITVSFTSACPFHTVGFEAKSFRFFWGITLSNCRRDLGYVEKKNLSEDSKFPVTPPT